MAKHSDRDHPHPDPLPQAGEGSRADPWHELRRFTPARIALGRSGASLPSAEWLRFGLAHAQARDAVHLAFDAEALVREAKARGFESIEAHSAAGDRATYLRRPDLGRRLDDASRDAMRDAGGGPSESARIAIVVADGLSAAAVHAHALPLLDELRPRLEAASFALAPLTIAHQARVALGDEIGALLHAEAVLMLIGERPGLSSPDSLGAYLTWAPRVGRNDAERNCVSNIRPQGLSYAVAAHRIAWLLRAARQLNATGVALKDESGAAPALDVSPR